MKKVDFDTIIDRKGTYCTQWDYIEDRFGKGSADLLPFTISDMDFKSPKEIIDMAATRINHGIFGYSRWNHGEYKGAIKRWYTKQSKANINEEWVVYAPSVLYSISLLLELINSNKVMTHTPRYDGFSKLLAPYELYEVPLKEVNGRYYTDFNLVEEGFKDGVGAFLLCNPQNPTGKVWTPDELKTLIDLCNKYKVYLISDEIHMDVTRKQFTSVLNMTSEFTIVVSSPTKTFNTPAFGGSYAIIPSSDLRSVFLEHTRSIDAVSTPSILGVLATIEAYTNCDYWVKELNDYILKNCEFVYSSLNNYKGLKVEIPEATYLMWIDFKDTGLSSNEFQELLMSKGRVAIMSGENYGDPYKIRLNVGSSIKKIEFGVEGIKKALESI